jgi:hypothetical protein
MKATRIGQYDRVASPAVYAPLIRLCKKAVEDSILTTPNVVHIERND